MKYWLLFNLAIILVLGTAQTTYSPMGKYEKFLRIRIVETPAGTLVSDVWYWRWVGR
jgi:hypothetical protein